MLDIYLPNGQIDLRKIRLAHKGPVGWPRRYLPDVGGPMELTSRTKHPETLDPTIRIGRDYNTILHRNITYLNTEFFRFACPSLGYSEVLLKRQGYVSLSNQTDIRHFRYRQPMNPVWTSIACRYNGISDLFQLDTIIRHPGYDRRWEFSFNTGRADSGEYELAHIPTPSWSLTLRDCKATSPEPDEHFPDGIWIHSLVECTPIPNSPLLFTGWTDEDLPPITLYPLLS